MGYVAQHLRTAARHDGNIAATRGVPRPAAEHVGASNEVVPGGGPEAANLQLGNDHATAGDATASEGDGVVLLNGISRDPGGPWRKPHGHPMRLVAGGDYDDV